MGGSMTAAETFEIACQIERNGAAFYRRAAELMDDADATKLLTDLAAMEVEHEQTFSTMLKDLEGENPEWLSRSFEAAAPDDPALYLQAAASGRVFDLDADPASKLGPSDSLASILTTAVGLEKETVVYYTGMKTAVPDNRGQAKLDAIIREEMGHIALLSNRLAELQA